MKMTKEEMREPQERSQHVAVAQPRVSRLTLLLLAIVIVSAAAALYSAIRSGIGARVQADTLLKQETLDMAVPTVAVVRPQPSSSAEELVLPGNAQAFVATPVYARVSGYLRKWYSDIGTHVKAGDLLAEIETPELDQQLNQARADLGAAQANYELARITADRYLNLLKTEAVARQDADNKTGDMRAKKALAASAASNVRRLEELQRFQKVYAPFDGVITARNTDIGALIDAGANSPGKELFDLSATGRLRVFVNVPQTYFRWAAAGKPAELTLAEYPGRVFTGKIARTADAIDPTARTLLTEVDVENKTGELLPGVFLSVHLRVGARSGAVSLPANSLIFRAAGLQVAVVRSGKAILVPVTVSRDFGATVEISDGVTTADLVIENPSDSLTSGTPVRVLDAQAGKGAK